MLLVRVAALLLLMVSANAFAQENDGAFLDPKYKSHHHPSKSVTGKDVFSAKPPSRSDTASVIAQQSAVKSQASRGTCSIFSATAMLEAMLIKKFNFDTSTDLSEEWLEYLIMRKTASEGSSSSANFSAFVTWGSADEALLPYIGMEWESVIPGTLSETRCGHLATSSSFTQKACLLGHRDPNLLNLSDKELEAKDPELLTARQDAAELRDQYIKVTSTWFTVSKQNEIKTLLSKGVPVTLDIDFYYGAWNHRVTADLGIPRNLDHWKKGIVGYPLRDSLDQTQSLTDPAGHSILLVGYDDTVVIELEHEMPDGTIVKKEYKGVYYFKNSWGTANFGVEFTLDGVVYPGYGMIVQDYAHEYGTFFKLPLQ